MISRALECNRRILLRKGGVFGHTATWKRNMSTKNCVFGYKILVYNYGVQEVVDYWT